MPNKRCAQSVVHRDIKRANIMRLNNGQINVTDFGIARIISQSKTVTGTVMGTPSYKALQKDPEKRHQRGAAMAATFVHFHTPRQQARSTKEILSPLS
jgi:serine/threonine-protein kinase